MRGSVTARFETHYPEYYSLLQKYGKSKIFRKDID